MRKYFLFALLIFCFNSLIAQVNPGNVGTANLTAWFRPDDLTLGNVNAWASTWPAAPAITLSDTWGTEFPIATNTPPGATANYNTTIDFFGNNVTTAKVLGNGTNLNLLNNNLSTGQGTMVAVYFFRPDLLPNGGHVVQYREANSGGDGIQFRGLGNVTPGVGTLRLAIGSGDSPNGARDRPIPLRPSISSYTGNKSSTSSMSTFYNNGLYNNPISSSTTGSTGLYLGARLDAGNFSGFHIGYISEVIFYNIDLSVIDRTKVESYLAIKYGITLSNVGGGAQGNYLSASGTLIWEAALQSNYHNDVIGIARDDAQGLLQKQSHTFDDSCRIYLGTLQNTNVDNLSAFGNDAAFLLMGHNNGRLCGTTQAFGEMPAGLGSRIEREFKVTKTNFNEPFNWDLKIDSCQALNLVNLTNLKLLVDADGDFSDANIFGAADGLTFSIANGVLSVVGISNIHVPNNQTSYLTIAYEDIYLALEGPEWACEGSDIVLSFVVEGTTNPINVTYYINGTAVPLTNVVHGQQVVVTTNATTFTYGIQPYNGVFNCCPTIDPTEAEVTIIPLEPIPIVAHYEVCGDSTFSWVTWDAFSPNLASGTITSLFGPANFTVTHSVGLMSSSPTIFGGTLFPEEYEVPIGETVLRNDSEGTLTFCFDQPILNPYFLFASIGTPNLSVPILTSVPYEIVWEGQAVTYQDSLNFTGTEGYNIISFPGWQTCIDVSFLASEVWTNITIGNYLPNCPADTVCEGTGVVLNAGLLGTYTWSPATYLDTTAGNSVISTPFSNITYTVQNTDPNYCLAPASFTIVTIPNEPTEFTQVAGICAGQPLAPLPTTSNNGIPGSWSPEMNNQETTTYVFSPQGCAAPALMTIVVTPNTVPSFSLPNSICQNASLNNFPNTSNDGISGSWSPAPNNQTTTTYTFTPNPGSGCVLPASITINVVENVQPSFNIQSSYCAGDNIPAMPTISQNGAAGTWSPAVNNQSTTNYVFTPNPGVCAFTANQLITINPRPNFSLGPDLILCPEDVVQLGVADEFASYLWNTGATSPSISISSAGTYQLTVTNNFGCQQQDQVAVTYLLGCADLVMPNVFSPNADNINEQYWYAIPPNIVDIEIVIINRWGQTVFFSNDPSVYWDGIDQLTGQPSTEGVYFYKINYRRIELQESFEQHGFIHLIR
jgi:gliding motility-associated-like protein